MNKWQPTSEGPTRKSSYEKPMLQRFGGVEELTRNVGNMGNKDGGAGTTSRSQL